jgi:tripartite-type tricarboxylate transporter receptor subunit TctC
MTTRRPGTTKFSALLGLALSLALAGNEGAAQDRYPSKPIRLVVSFAAGGPTDTVARITGARMSELLGQPIVVENRTGAGGNIGADVVAKAAPDGYTLLMATVSTHAINPGLYKKMPYDPVLDFVPVGQVGVTPCVLAVNPSIPVRDVKGLIELLKANPGKYSYGSSGMGSILHLCGEEFKSMAGGLDAVHVPYRGSAPMMTDLVGGQIAFVFDALPTVLPQVQAGSIRAIGGGMATRARAMPDLPTLQEQGVKGFECYTWNAILAPAKTPAPIVTQLSEVINRALADPAVLKRLQDTGVDPTPGGTPEKLSDFIKAELAKWAPIIKASGAQVD